MKRRIPGLHQQAQNGDGILEGVFLVRVERASYRYHPQKPFFVLCFAILQPQEHTSRTFSGRLYCTPKALWKLSWFLRDFGYDAELFGQDEVDEKALVGLRGIVKVSRAVVNGRCFVNLDAFSPAAEWEELPVTSVASGDKQEESHDL
jgi:hypothetical protein